MSNEKADKTNLKIEPQEEDSELGALANAVRDIANDEVHLSVLLRGRISKRNGNDEMDLDTSENYSPEREIQKTMIPEQELRETLRKAALRTLGERVHYSPIKYDPSYDMHNQETMRVPLSEVPSVTETLKGLRPDNDTFKPDKKGRLSVHGYILQYGMDLFGFIKARQGQAIWDKKTLLNRIPLTLTDGQIYRMKVDSSFFIPNYLDALLYKDIVYVFSNSAFEKFFDLKEQLMVSIQQDAKLLGKYVDKPEDLTEKCHTLQNTKRLYDCIDKLKTGNYSVDKAKDIIERKGLTVKFNKKGQIDFARSILSEVLDVLGDSYVIGETTAIEYLARNKRRS